VNNQFNGGGLFAGVLGVPAVAFAPTRPPSTSGGNFKVETGGALLDKALLNLEAAPAPAPAKTAPAKAAPRVQEVVTESAAVGAPAGLVETNPVNLKLGLTGINQFFHGPNSPVKYAANGGSVLPCVLTGAVLKGNTFTNLTVAALLVGEAGTLEFTNNEVSACAGGFWLLSASMAGMVALDPQQLATAGLVVALGYPLPVGDSQPVKVPAAPSPILVYTGEKSFKDQSGNTWPPESSEKSLKVSGDSLHPLSQPKPPHAITNPLPDTSDEPLYQNERWGVFTYTFKVPVDGFYQVTLKFAEIAYSTSGSRIFDVAINGLKVLADFDIFNDVGGQYIADDQVFSNIVPLEGKIVIGFTRGTKEVDWPKIAAVQIEPQWDGSIANPYLTPADAAPFYTSELSNFYGQLAQLAQQGYVSSGMTALRLRLDDNEMTGLTSAAGLILWDDQIQNGNTSSLMMSGNRWDAAVTLFEVIDRREETGSFYFMSVASIALVERCVVSGNMLLNEGKVTNQYDKRGRRYSLILDANGDLVDLSPAHLTYMPPPLTELSVAGNVFQGLAGVSPQPATALRVLNSETL
jgi:hypothetical protein